MYRHTYIYKCVYRCVTMYMHIQGYYPCPQEKNWQSGCQAKEDFSVTNIFLHS